MEFRYGGTNITAFRLVDPEQENIQQTIRNWEIGEQKLGKRIDFRNKVISLYMIAHLKVYGVQTLRKF